mmetsp:Transcript_50661/g.167833  ORF Transcript_50661/g.167833 Transcript_50661/m.167833 type:complete len:231 (+) Transcript_50661:1108-1800(+)
MPAIRRASCAPSCDAKERRAEVWSERAPLTCTRDFEMIDCSSLPHGLSAAARFACVRWAPPCEPEPTMKATVRLGSSRCRAMSARTAGGHVVRPSARFGRKAAHSSACRVSRFGPPSAAEVPGGGNDKPLSRRSRFSREESSRDKYSISERRLYEARCACAYCAAAGGPPVDRTRCHSSKRARAASGSEQPRAVKCTSRGLKNPTSSSAAAASAAPSVAGSAAGAAAARV